MCCVVNATPSIIRIISNDLKFSQKGLFSLKHLNVRIQLMNWSFMMGNRSIIQCSGRHISVLKEVLHYFVQS